MTFIFAAVISAAFGLAIGAVAERVPVSSIWQSLAAVFLALVVSILVATVVVNVRPPDRAGGIAAVSVGINALLVFVTIVVALAAAGHALLGQLGGTAPPLAGHRPMVLGSAAGICGALSIVWIFTNALRSA